MSEVKDIENFTLNIQIRIKRLNIIMQKILIFHQHELSQFIFVRYSQFDFF